MTAQPTSTAPLTVRSVRWDDLNAVAQLIYAICEAEGDTSVAVTPDDLALEWKFEGFDPEQHACVVADHTGRLLGYAAVFDIDEHCELSGDIYLHPNDAGSEVSALLLGALEDRARAHVPLAAPGLRVFMRIPIDNKNETSKNFFVNAGYTAIRYHWRMGIELTAAPPAPVLPAGLEFRPFIQAEHGEAVWQARNEAFKDNWGSHSLNFEDFSYYTFDNPAYDPTLWRVIWDGNQVAGFSINHLRMGIGWVHMLGVCPRWRTQGLGLALLQHTFGEFYRRELKSIGLGVDAANLSGATRLYQKAGMRTVSEFVTFEKELRAGQTVTAPADC